MIDTRFIWTYSAIKPVRIAALPAPAPAPFLSSQVKYSRPTAPSSGGIMLLANAKSITYYRTIDPRD